MIIKSAKLKQPTQLAWGFVQHDLPKTWTVTWRPDLRLLQCESPQFEGEYLYITPDSVACLIVDKDSAP